MRASLTASWLRYGISAHAQREQDRHAEGFDKAAEPICEHKDTRRVPLRALQRDQVLCRSCGNPESETLERSARQLALAPAP